MPRRLSSSYSFRMLLAAVAGAAVGAALAAGAEQNSALFALRLALTALSGLAFTLGHFLAFPLLLGAIIAGTDGLEPMRGAGRLAGKALLWIACASAAAALVGVFVALVCPVGLASYTPQNPLPPMPGLSRDPRGTTGWLALVAVAIGLGVYRNQIEESRARLLMRFATAVRETATLAFSAARPWLPAAVFMMAVAQAPVQAALWINCRALLLALAGGWAVYGLLALPAALWLGARISPVRYAAAVSPAICAGLAGGPSRAILPLTFDAVCRRGGVSARVASTVLALCAALQRDGQGLGLTLAPLFLCRLHGVHLSAGLIALLALNGWLAGCGFRSAWLVTLGIVNGSLAAQIYLPLLAFDALIAGLGNSVTLFSHACAAAVIARSEGEKGFLPALPADDNALILDDLFT